MKSAEDVENRAGASDSAPARLLLRAPSRRPAPPAFTCFHLLPLFSPADDGDSGRRFRCGAMACRKSRWVAISAITGAEQVPCDLLAGPEQVRNRWACAADTTPLFLDRR